MLQSERIDNVFIEGSQEVAHVIQPRSQSGSSHCRSFAPVCSAHSFGQRAPPLPSSPALPVLPALTPPIPLAALPLSPLSPLSLCTPPIPTSYFPQPSSPSPGQHGARPQRMGAWESPRAHACTIADAVCSCECIGAPSQRQLCCFALQWSRNIRCSMYSSNLRTWRALPLALRSRAPQQPFNSPVGPLVIRTFAFCLGPFSRQRSFVPLLLWAPSSLDSSVRGSVGRAGRHGRSQARRALRHSLRGKEGNGRRRFVNYDQTTVLNFQGQLLFYTDFPPGPDVVYRR